mmetsp:Transcript_26546/g.40704  ORF Transcript_26546/g.40704 Transcript_26546/m.40704 type:complete len:251 (+) Transcript_26546:133-885(+)
MIPEIVISHPSLPILGRRFAGSNSGWTALGRFPVSRIYCIGRNYREHAIEMGHDPDREPPFFFQKPSNAVVDTYGGDGIVPYPPMTSNLHFEGELVVCIGKEGGGHKPLPLDDVESHIFGYAIGCDLTRRDLQAEAKKLSRPWAVAKGFDFSAPCGPVVPKDQVSISGATPLSLKVGGKTRQETTIEKMIWPIPETISYLSKYFRLMPGDLIMTGTPAGVGAIEINDEVTITCGELPPCKFTVKSPLSSA